MKNDAEPPANIYLSFINATPGVIAGKLHRNLSLGGELEVGGINVGANSQLTLNGAHVSGTTAILDWIANLDGSLREQGAVLISSGTYSGTTFRLKNAGSTMQGGNWTNVQVSTRANIQDATFIGSSIGFSGNGSIAFSSNVLTGTSVSVAESIVATIEANTFTSSSLGFAGTASGSIDANSFSGSAVIITQQARVTVSGNAFTGDRPDNSGFIIVATDAGVLVDGNNLHFRNTSETHHAILIQPDTTPAHQGTAYTLSNNILTGQNAGIGIQVHTDCYADVPDISIIDNTVARFTRAVSFDNRMCSGSLITATVTGNTLTGNSYGILATLEGAGNALSVHNNCIAANTTGGISRAAAKTLFWMPQTITGGIGPVRRT